MWIEICLFIITLTLYWILIATRHPKDFPPGPRGYTLPMLGDFLQIGRDRKSGIDKLRKEFGDVLGLWYGPVRNIIVNDFQTIQEVGTSPDFVDRHQSFFLEIVRGTVKSGNGRSVGGVLFAIGPSWMEQRHFTLRTLRDLGFGKKAMEDLIAEEAAKLCDFIDKTKGNPIEAKPVFNMAVINSLWHIVAGLKFDYDNKKLQDTIQLIDHIVTPSVTGPLSIVIQNSKVLLTLLRRFDKLKIFKVLETITAYISDIVEDHKQNFQEDHAGDFLDLYIKHMKQQESKCSELSFVGEDGENNVRNLLLDLFLAGAETTSNTLNHAMYFMLQNPDIMTKVQAELAKVTGGSRMPTLADKDKTPYTEAVLLEVQRLANITPVIVRSSSADTTICNGKYFIPKRTRATLNVGAMMMNPDNFPSPDKFDPMRYIGSQGQFQPDPKVLPFGMGRRRCLGENLAKMSLYLLFTALLTHYDLKKEQEDTDLSGLSIEGELKTLKPFKMRFIKRS